MTTPDPPDPDSKAASNGSWTFLTNHARVLLELARKPDARLRDVATHAGITERAAQGIVADLVAGGYLSKARIGRRNKYTINPSGHFRHPAEANHFVGDLLNVFAHDPERSMD
jgi:hypothetical protein